MVKVHFIKLHHHHHQAHFTVINIILLILRKAMPSFFRVLQMTWVTSHNTNQTSSFPPPSPITPKEALNNVEFCLHCTLSLIPRHSRWLSLGIPFRCQSHRYKLRQITSNRFICVNNELCNAFLNRALFRARI